MQDFAKTLSEQLRARGDKLVTAESCTGGMIAYEMTNLAGSSEIFERGFVIYSNEAKHECLGVPNDTLKTHGAVSEQTAIAMAKGALNNSRADIAISVTGIAGPSGGSSEKPVGTVYIGTALKNGPASAQKHIFKGSRQEVREQSTKTALQTLINLLEET